MLYIKLALARQTFFLFQILNEFQNTCLSFNSSSVEKENGAVVKSYRVTIITIIIKDISCQPSCTTSAIDNSHHHQQQRH